MIMNISISACIIAYELRVQKHLKKWKDKDWRYDVTARLLCALWSSKRAHNPIVDSDKDTTSLPDVEQNRTEVRSCGVDGRIMRHYLECILNGGVYLLHRLRKPTFLKDMSVSAFPSEYYTSSV